MTHVSREDGGSPVLFLFSHSQLGLLFLQFLKSYVRIPPPHTHIERIGSPLDPVVALDFDLVLMLLRQHWA